jgi:predicted RNA-binding Zn-ribbon protein involved in translation (DUF1610 family)
LPALLGTYTWSPAATVVLIAGLGHRQPLNAETVGEPVDDSYGKHGVEVKCAHCGLASGARNSRCRQASRASGIRLLCLIRWLADDYFGEAVALVVVVPASFGF